MKAIGLDIGTTSICVTVVDAQSGETVLELTAANDANIFSHHAFECLQSPQVILETAKGLMDQALHRSDNIVSIGVTGQMHGIVYLDASGRAVSPLHTWQDRRGDLPYRDGKSYAQHISGHTGEEIASGYGAVTHFYNTVNGLVPRDAAVFCTIHDYCAMRLAGATAPVAHISDAASIGLYHFDTYGFDRAAIEGYGMDADTFPRVTKEVEALGAYEGVPVFTAVGDNQASFIGSVSDMEHSILVNVGTGSQISVYLPNAAARSSGGDGDFERRPCTGDGLLLAGCSLCGGRAYALLENFFRQTAQLAGVQCDSLFMQMDRLAETRESLQNRLVFSTLFGGTRKNAALRASIENLGTDNFTPAHFICGVIDGVVNELYHFCTEAEILKNRRFDRLVGSGNGIRKSAVMQRVFSERFGMPLDVPRHREEAAYGAALLALTASGVFPDIGKAQELIRYI